MRDATANRALLLVGAILLGGCASVEKRDKLLPSDHSPQISHCRLGMTKDGPVSWLIGETTLNDLLSKNGISGGQRHAYWIFKSEGSTPSPKSAIFPGDQMEIYKDGNSIRLRHTGRRNGDLLDVVTEPLELSKESGKEGLYAIGKLFEGKWQVGTYFVFWTAEGDECEHPDYKNDTCKRLHFEYFKLNQHDDYLPPKMIEVQPKDGCPMPNQTDDGDGDEGVRKTP